MNENELHCRMYFPENDPDDLLIPMHERIIEFAVVDVNYVYLSRLNEMMVEE